MAERDEREMPPEVRAAAKRLPKGVRAVIAAVAQGMAEQVRELHQRIAELEARPVLHEEGVWTADKAYGVNAIVSDRGSAWIAKRATCRRPGDDDSWRLLVKRGRDGRDAKAERGDR